MTGRIGKAPRRRYLLAVTAAVLVGAVSAPSAAGADTEGRRGDGVQRGLDVLVGQDKFTGALAAVSSRDGRTRDYTAGASDRETGKKVPVDGRIRIGSNTKTFTATVVLQLVGEGKIELDEPVETYLPGVVRGKGGDGRKITVRQLLQHTSGLPDYVDPVMGGDFVGNYLSLRHTYFEPRQLTDTALQQPPSSGWSYSNTNYIIAGLLVQRVTGRPIGEEITTRIIDRIGLRDTYWPQLGEQDLRGKHPKGYFATKDGNLVDVTRQDISMAWAAGALVSTPSDVTRFFSALVGGKLLRPQELAEMQSTVDAPGFDTVGGSRYGLGIATFKLSCGGQAWSHGGNTPGYTIVNGATTDGRAASVAVTALPSTIEGLKHLDETLDSALCQGK
ncbi:serine hydrolase [Amycolatopsis sp. WAC 01375]|uniref:serine hydrolase domain-containing protein n=1 Tax=unclassified Amycolatopsis TaxID=2618356 RepID=UPI000F77EA2C|nr:MULTISPECIES: serine hydrolase domain-containing protein [unclassified Amycolatopsis]RSM69311.1 serine hydrolase [Amycolatopsis sp. WAC 01375]RSN30629.1 serine hydrolase [Amycolatopsis sp. WAC 01416]